MTRAATCRHGYWPTGSYTVSNPSKVRAIDGHEATCRRANVFSHRGFLFRLICCAGCRRRIA